MDSNKVDTATKYQVELNSKYSNYSKQGSDNGNNTKDTLLSISKEQANKNKESR